MFSFPIYKEAVITDSITTFLKLPKICRYPNICSLQVSTHVIVQKSWQNQSKSSWNTWNTSNSLASKGGNATYFCDPLLLSCFQPWKGHFISANVDFFIDIIGLVYRCFFHYEEKHGIFTKYKPNERETCNNTQHHWVVLAAFGCEAELRREQSPQRGRTELPAFPIPYKSHGFYGTHNLLPPVAGWKGYGCPADALLPSA